MEYRTVFMDSRTKDQGIELRLKLLETTAKKEIELLKTSIGLVGKLNPLFELDIDLFHSVSETFKLLVDISCFRCTPIECLHIIHTSIF